jgi:hypothetical protein
MVTATVPKIKAWNDDRPGQRMGWLRIASPLRCGEVDDLLASECRFPASILQSFEQAL